MAVPGFLRPSSELTDEVRQRGLKALTFQAIAASGADGLMSGGFLAAFALLLGASNFHIGILTALPFLMQTIQIAAVIVVERLRMRKLIAVPSYFTVYVSWVPIALIPFVVEIPDTRAVILLLFFTGIRGVGNALVNTSWTSWLREMAGAGAMGDFFARRLRVATIAAAATSLAGAFYIDWWKGVAAEENVIFGYSYAILFGSIALGLSAVVMMARIPEPRMAALDGVRPSIMRTLTAPLRDVNYRQLVGFLGLWNFVAHLAAPFFAVYMLTKLELSLSIVVGLGVLSQVANVLFLRVWGPLADRFGSKAVLSICSSLYFLVILGWTFTTLPDVHRLTMPLLVFLHFLIGIASAGINVATTTIRMKLAPQAQATAFLTVSSLAANLGAAISPLLGGAFVDFFSVRHLKLAVEWVDPERVVSFPAMFLTGYDFLFTVAFVLGLFTLGTLARIKEEGEAESEVVLEELMSQTRENLRALNFVPGLSFVTRLPLAGMRYLPPIPGLNVAANVTAYQIASSIRYTVEGIAFGAGTARQAQARVNQAVARASRESRDISRQGAAIAFGATQGSMRAIAQSGLGAGRLVKGSVRGTLTAVSRAGAHPRDAVRGAVHGAIHGASDADLEIEAVVAQSIDAVRDSAAELGLSEEEVVQYAAEAAMEAAAELAQESQKQVRDVVLDELMERGSDPEQ